MSMHELIVDCALDQAKRPAEVLSVLLDLAGHAGGQGAEQGGRGALPGGAAPYGHGSQHA